MHPSVSDEQLQRTIAPLIYHRARMVQTKVKNSLWQKLEDALVNRSVDAGFALLDESFGKTGQLDRRRRDAISLLLCLAEWADLGYRDVAFLDSLLRRLLPRNPAQLSQLSCLDFLKLRLVQGYSCLRKEDFEGAISLFELALRAGENMMPLHMVFLANFWVARAHRKRGEYAEALLHISAARESARQANAPKLVAAAKIDESWLIFHKGERHQAFQLLDEAEGELRSTGHALSLGNIESARGRFVRRSGEYALALAHFERAIAIYSAGYSNHTNCARALVNAAYVKQLIALDIQLKMRRSQARGATHARYLQISSEALQLLQQAREIYVMHHHQGGTGSVLVNSGYLHLESGDIDKATMDGEEAFSLGTRKRDQLLVARARILQTEVELARSEEELGEHPDAGLHAHLAVQYADEAIEIATQQKNSRLLAAAYIARGSAAADQSFEDWDAAKDCATKAACLIEKGDRDYMLRELSALKSKILRSTGIDQTLRMWSDGQVGNKTFQQVEEEFADLVIPKIWVRLGKNVTRVARELHISPKKVRKSLRNAGQTGLQGHRQRKDGEKLRR